MSLKNILTSKVFPLRIKLKHVYHRQISSSTTSDLFLTELRNHLRYLINVCIFFVYDTGQANDHVELCEDINQLV